MSLVFYGWVTPWFLIIITASVLVNFALSRLIHAGKHRKITLAAGITVNLAALFSFKYFDFFISTVNAVVGADFNLLHLILPLGISFFTFQQLSYVIDVYTGRAPKYDFLEYAAFILFFPQLVAGPICLHSELVPQFADKSLKRFNWDNFSPGIMAFAFGLAKKVLLADPFGAVASAGFNGIGGMNSAGAWIAVLCYSVQIYFDFSGYSDMATGLSLMFNIKQPKNFDSPYRSRDILEFWKRWHITLTRFLTQYIYIPLGGSRKGTSRTYVNVTIVFFASGVWHGAGWTFIIWGLAHGAFSVITRAFKKQFDKLHAAVAWLITFGFVTLSWVPFRAANLSQTVTVYKKLFAFNGTDVPKTLTDALQSSGLFNVIKTIGVPHAPSATYQLIGVLIFALFAVVQLKNTTERVDAFKPRPVTACVTVLLLAVSILSIAGGVSEFIYWQF